ncbi:uncharacterized protein LOC110374244 isoform X2 [Helicoverpa armigera]|uniref:uncharacterized protein LOC110374244 isoform X2 n=1 Tax=Helicoverpa armigera TaxID=29058 RepID=UPI0030826C52
MNSRSSVNESNLVNLSGDLSALNQLDAKESLALSFPFDHIYACHSEDSDRRQAHLDKEVEVSSHPDDKEAGVAAEPTFEITRLSERLTAAEIQNKRLKNLLVYHLDLIQQQNELITKKDKQNTALKLENDSLKSKVTRMDRRITVSQRHNVNPAPVINVPPPNATSTTIKSEPATTDNQVVFNSLTDFLVPESRANSYVFNNDASKTKPLMPPESFDLNRPSETDVTTYLPGDISVPSILDNSSLQCDNFGTMIENKRSYIKKEIKTEPRPEPLYTVTSNSGNTVIQKIQRNRRRTSGSLGSLSRLPKTPTVKTEPPENVNMFDDDKAFERTFSVNKKSKMINTYGKSKTSTLPKKTLHYTGSLSDRLQLIDTTPTGEDPYQLGEADMREQSPIPKLMLQKTNHGRMKICSDLSGDSAATSRRIYDVPATETSTKMPNKIKLEKRYNLPNIVPYSAPQSTTHTSTHTTQTPSDACTHVSTYTHVTKPDALTPKRIATLTPKQTSTLTTNACTHMSTYTHPTRNTSTRTGASHKAAKGQHKSPPAASRKSPHSAASKGLQKGVLKSSLTSPHTTMASLTPLHVVPLSGLQTTHSSLTTPLTPVSASLTIPEIKKESLESPTTSPLMQQSDLDNIKKEPNLEWPLFSTLYSTARTETSLCDFSYGENPNLTPLPTLDVSEFRQLIDAEAAAEAAVDALTNNLDYGSIDKNESDKMKKRGARTTSLVGPEEDPSDSRRGMGSKRGRKRALSAAGVIKNSKQNLSKPVGPKAKMVKGKAACRGKKSPLPGMMTRKPYHTLVGDPDLSWYLGLDPDVKMEDIDQGDCKASTVEVPRWREKPYTSLYSLEGTENLDDKVFEKRHQKLEAEERRQLRWHMRRIREQRHVERLRMRQRDPWYSGHSPYQPSVYTIWPQPQRDVRMIEITDTIPVMAFGEDLPDLPPADFMLPWVRTSKALKRSKRSKTLH